MVEPTGETFEPVIQIDAQRFTDTERQLILQVVARDEDIRLQEKSRIQQLKDDLKHLQEKGISTEEEEEYGRACKRCRTPLGIIFNSGSLCSNCQKKVCKTCRVSIEKDENMPSWLCTVCSKIRDIRAESGAWFYDANQQRGKIKKVYGSFLMKRLFSKVKKRDAVIYKDPNWTDIIEQDDIIPEEDDEACDRGYLVVSSGMLDDFYVHEGNKSNEYSSKAVVGASKLVKPLQNSNTTQADNKNKIQKHSPVKLLALAHSDISSVDEDSCVGSEITSPAHEGFSNVEEINLSYQSEDPDEHTEDNGIHSPGIYYQLKSDSLSDQEEINIASNNTLYEYSNKDYYHEKEHCLSDSIKVSMKTHLDEHLSSSSDNVQGGFYKDSAEVKLEELEPIDSLISETEHQLDIVVQVRDDSSNYSKDNEIFRHIPEGEFLKVPENNSDIFTKEEMFGNDQNNELQDFKEQGTQLENRMIIKRMPLNENIFLKPMKWMKQEKKSAEITSLSSINFSVMQKADSLVSNVEVVHNDLDLRELQKAFVRRKHSNFIKVKTDEHSDGNGSCTSSDEDEDDFIITQVVLERQTSFEEQINKFYEELHVEKKNQIQISDEEVVLKKTNFEKKIDGERFPEDKLSLIDFSKMLKVGSITSPTTTTMYEDDNDDFKLFISAVSKKSKAKPLIQRTVEHSDIVDSSGESEVDVNSDVNSDVPNDHVANDVKHSVTEEVDDIFNDVKKEQDFKGSVESIVSGYSDDEDIQPPISVAGEVLIGLKYDHNECVFEAQVHKAKELIPVDLKRNTTDPYVKIYLQPDTKQGGKRKTKPEKNSLNPNFDEVLSFNIGYEDLLMRKCLVSVWHNDIYKNIHLGEVSIDLAQYVNSGFSLDDPAPQWYTLSEKKISRTQMSFIGDITFNMCYQAPKSLVTESKKEQKKLPNPTKGELHILIKSAKNVKCVHNAGYSNPFCKIILLSEVHKPSKYKTTVKKETLNPIWNEEFVFDNISWAVLQDYTLQLSLWHSEKGNKKPEFLGATRIGLGKLDGLQYDSFGEEVTVWQAMLDHTNEDIESTLSLRSTLHSVKHEVFAPPVPVKVITEDEHIVFKKKKKKESSGSQSSLAKWFLNADTISLASSGSMLSIYSSAGGEHGNLVITGEILFSMKHDIQSGIFSVTVEKAKGIAAVNSKQQTSDPYVKVYLLPDKTKTSKKKTTHRRKTLNPQWNETIKYKLNHEELLKTTLQLSIWNHDRFGRNDFLGEIQVNMKHYASLNNLDVPESVWYTLQEMAPISIGGVEDNKGELLLSLKYDHETLTVNIQEAHGLPAADPLKLSNPFVKFYLLPDKSRKAKRKTAVQRKTINPIWNEKFTYNRIPVGDLQSRVLEVTIWDHDSSGHQFLGGLRLGLPQGDEYWHDCFSKEINIWETMIKHLGIFAEYTIPLRATMTSRKGQEFSSLPMILATNEEKETTLPFMDIQNIVLLSGEPVVRMALKFVSPDPFEVDEKKYKKGKAKGHLKVHLKEARYLPSKLDGDVPSTFCKVLMHPKKKNIKFKTDIYRKSVEPIWDTEMTFEDVTLDELRTKGLEVIVYDEGTEKKGNIIGTIRLGSGGNIEKRSDSSGHEIELWNSMLNNPDQWNMKMVPLRIVTVTKVVTEEKKAKCEKKKQKQLLEDELDDLTEENEPGEKQSDGNESPRTSALRAMGVHATNVIDIIQSKEPETPVFMPPQESLSPIDEENELESSGSFKNRHEVPAITINEVKPGDPPFPGAGAQEEPDVDYPIKEKKKQSPAMSLLKRSTSHESLSSIYSTDSANVYGQVPIRGEVQFGMKYDYGVGMFEVHIFQARDIAAVDTKKEISDPYCKVYLLPDKTKNGKKKTKTRKKTLSPEWEEILEYKISLRDLRTRTLWLALWHLERFGRNIFLGEVMINMDSLIDNENSRELESPTPKWYTLCEKGIAPMTELYKGELRISLMFEDESLLTGKQKQRFEEQKELSGKKKKKKKKKEKISTAGKINIHIKEGSDLPAADKDGMSDPFCKCYLLPLKGAKTRRKTPVIRHTRNPVWDYKTEYDIDYEDLADHGIEFTVWDWDRGVQNDFLGCSRINLGSRSGTWDDAEGIEILAWQHLIDNPNKWKDFTLSLRSKKDERPKKGY